MEILPTILVLSLIVNVLLWHMLGQTKATAVSRAKTRENKRIYDNIRTLVSNINDPRKISVINDLVRFAIPDSLQDAEVNTFSKRHTITKESVLRRHQEIEEWNQEP